MKAPSTLAATLEKLERELHDPNVRNGPRVAGLLADDFLEFGRSGRVYDKGQILEALRLQPAEPVISAEYKVTPLGPDVALVTYRSFSNASPPAHTLRSSV